MAATTKLLVEVEVLLNVAFPPRVRVSPDAPIVKVPVLLALSSMDPPLAKVKELPAAVSVVLVVPSLMLLRVKLGISKFVGSNVPVDDKTTSSLLLGAAPPQLLPSDQSLVVALPAFHEIVAAWFKPEKERSKNAALI